MYIYTHTHISEEAKINVLKLETTHQRSTFFLMICAQECVKTTKTGGFGTRTWGKIGG